MVLGWLVLFIGIAYGYMNPGKEDRMALLKKGTMIGVVLGIIFGVIGFFYARFSILGGLVYGFVGTIIEIVLLTIFFIVGTYIGDWLEVKFKK